MFMYSLVSTVKALSAARLECLSASYRFLWHGSRWIESPIEFLPHAKLEERATPSDRRLHRSNTAATAARIGNHRKPRTRDDSDLSRHTIMEDARSNRRQPLGSVVKVKSYSGGDFTVYDTANDDGDEEKAPLSPTVAAIRHDRHLTTTVTAQPRSMTITLDVTGSSFMDYDAHLGGTSQRAVADLAAQYKEGGELFNLAHGKFVACFSKYIRLEDRASRWPLRERALVLADDLDNEMDDLEREIRGSQWIDRF